MFPFIRKITIMNRHTKVSLVILCFASFVYPQPIPSEEFPHYAILDSRNENVLLYWKYDQETITFEMFGKTNGWVGMGISPNGGMIGADMFVGWVKDGVAAITDRHGTDRNAFPPMNEKQDTTLVSWEEKDGWTRIKFRRYLAGCEPDYDVTITTNTLKVIWALGESDPRGSDLNPSDYHGSIALNRGVRSLFLLEGNGGPPSQNNPNTQELNLLNNMTNVPNLDTFYACRLLKIPDFSSKHHVIKVEPAIEPGNEDIVHHVIVYQCSSSVMNSSNVGVTHECYTDNMPEDFFACTFVIYAWAIGGGAFNFPEHVGFPLGADDSPKYILLETHYDNPALRSGIVDRSGLRFVYTEQLRQYDAGVLEVGQVTYPYSFFIPPNATSFRVYGECNAECAGAGMQAIGRSDIRLFGALIHTHLLGRNITVHHLADIRNSSNVRGNLDNILIQSPPSLVGKSFGNLVSQNRTCKLNNNQYCKEQGGKFILHTFLMREGDSTLLNIQALQSQSAIHSFNEFTRYVTRGRRCITLADLEFPLLSLGVAPRITDPYQPPLPTCPSSAEFTRVNFLLFTALLISSVIMLL